MPAEVIVKGLGKKPRTQGHLVGPLPKGKPQEGVRKCQALSSSAQLGSAFSGSRGASGQGAETLVHPSRLYLWTHGAREKLEHPGLNTQQNSILAPLPHAHLPYAKGRMGIIPFSPANNSIDACEHSHFTDLQIDGRARARVTKLSYHLHLRELKVGAPLPPTHRGPRNPSKTHIESHRCYKKKKKHPIKLPVIP